MARAIGCSEPTSTAAASGEHLARSRCRRRRERPPPSDILPSVIVPVLSSRITSTSLARSKTSPPLNSTPSSAARPVPAMMASGRGETEGTRTGDDQDRDRRASIASAVLTEASTNHPRKVTTPRSPITIGTKTDEIRSASRCTGAFDPCACSSDRTMPASLVFGPTVVTKTIEPAVAVDRRTDHVVAGTDVDRHGFARQQRQVDPGLPCLHDAVGGDLLARTNHDELPGTQLRRSGSCARGRRPGRWRPSRLARSRIRDGVAGGDPSTCLEHLADQDQRDDDGRGVEVELLAAGEHRRRRCRRRRHPRPARSACPSCVASMAGGDARPRRRTATPSSPGPASSGATRARGSTTHRADEREPQDGEGAARPPPRADVRSCGPPRRGSRLALVRPRAVARTCAPRRATGRRSSRSPCTRRGPGGQVHGCLVDPVHRTGARSRPW